MSLETLITATRGARSSGSSMRQANELSAIPTETVSGLGALKTMSEEALVLVPFSFLRLEPYFINTAASVVAYHGHGF